MNGDMPPGTYKLQADVVDTFRNERAKGDVTVYVQHIGQPEFQHQVRYVLCCTLHYTFIQGAIRILMDETKGLEDPSAFLPYMSQFKNYLQGKVFKDGWTVEIFSIKKDVVIEQSAVYPVVDVRFFVRRNDDGFKDPIALAGQLESHKSAIRDLLGGAEIVAVSIDMCKFTPCDNGCQTVHRADYVSALSTT